MHYNAILIVFSYFFRGRRGDFFIASSFRLHRRVVIARANDALRGVGAAHLSAQLMAHLAIVDEHTVVVEKRRSRDIRRHNWHHVTGCSSQSRRSGSSRGRRSRPDNSSGGGSYGHCSCRRRVRQRLERFSRGAVQLGVMVMWRSVYRVYWVIGSLELGRR